MCHVFNLKSKDEVILKFEEISMTGLQLEQSLQGGADATNLIILVMKSLCEKISHESYQWERTFVTPLNKVKGFPMLSQTIVLKNSKMSCTYFPPKCRTTKIWRKRLSMHSPFGQIAKPGPPSYLQEL